MNLLNEIDLNLYLNLDLVSFSGLFDVMRCDYNSRIAVLRYITQMIPDSSNLIINI